MAGFAGEFEGVRLLARSPSSVLTCGLMSAPFGETRLFPIAGYGEEFHVGTTADGEHVLMGLLSPYVVAYIFSASGDLVRRVCREWEYPAPRMAEGGPYEIYDPAFQSAVSMQIRGLRWLLSAASRGPGDPGVGQAD